LGRIARDWPDPQYRRLTDEWDTKKAVTSLPSPANGISSPENPIQISKPVREKRR